MTAPLSLADLNACPASVFAAQLADVFEHAPWVAAQAAAQRPFATADALHTAMLAIVGALPEDARVAVFCGHPELAGPAARTGAMTPDSIREQGALALDRLPHEEEAWWDRLNAAYRTRFGFPFILCARHYTVAAMRQVFAQRLGNSREAEIAATLREIGLITRYRLAARIADHGLADLEGRLTTHVLDTSRGQPAQGLRLALHQVDSALPCSTGAALIETVTDSHGQTGAPLISGQPLRIGRYELRFHVGDYFRSIGAVDGPWPFLDVVPIVFSIDEPTGDYHVPLTITPWAYATYRGQ
ncbi:2-oxo-4-hydroxy-4-carboxy-5-ureidoimidazoline decarboxylase [Aquabacter spiritensis]|uniref:2-oxo-4-hydroxy-4-carboxy-5-ureidoimidazoline decarboxylase n=1 Tax=Aquabacter spiritensis TaxID=933073 RepID=A0A4R3LZF8_9HYPH|nr:2-oxo-4-hydroxy-4-carboxy-5-ureidoimidazoline decarboxylase [Aquabacter spiritensis]TCT06144.1 2-oxo-4-hydroxy-4-carboxy-5-ureidoimidazoline decarboxylase [Aquabacter spiritensis]